MSAVAGAGGVADEPRAPTAPLRLAVVGISIREHCGVHDYGRLLGEALSAQGVEVSHHWLTRREIDRFGPARAEISDWCGRLAGELGAERPAAVVLQYSVFSYAHKGLPVFVR